MCNATLHETTRLRTNVTHVIERQPFYHLFGGNQTKINTANRKFQMNFIEELIRANFASEPMYQTHMPKKTFGPLGINSTNFQADKKPFQLLREARASISIPPQNHFRKNL